jgi:hypothetical protein
MGRNHVRENSFKNAKTRKRSGLTPAFPRRTFALPRQELRPRRREPTDRPRSIGRFGGGCKTTSRLRRGLGPGRPSREGRKARTAPGGASAPTGPGAVVAPGGYRETGRSLGRGRTNPSGAAPKGNAEEGTEQSQERSTSGKEPRLRTGDRFQGLGPGDTGRVGRLPSGSNRQEPRFRLGPRRDHTRTGGLRLNRAGRGDRKDASTADRVGSKEPPRKVGEPREGDASVKLPRGFPIYGPPGRDRSALGLAVGPWTSDRSASPRFRTRARVWGVAP